MIDPDFKALCDPRNDATYWWPRLKLAVVRAGISVPRTVMVKTGAHLLSLCEGKMPRGAKELFKNLALAIKEIGTPCFLRSGQTSGKHQWSRTCYLPDATVLGPHVAAIVEFSEMVSIMGLPTGTWLVREFIKTQPVFHIPFYDGMPINRERRYFVSDGKVVAHIPYWPPDVLGSDDSDLAVYRRRGVPENWRELLAEISQEPEVEVDLLSRYSETIAECFAGAWSVDFMQAADGKWYCIDMALAAASWGCPKALAAKGADDGKARG